MLKALIFDCDGVIADTEPLHMAMFQKVLHEEGIELSEHDYYAEYLALDDRGCYTKAFARLGQKLTDERLAELICRKASYIEPAFKTYLKIFPGAAELIRGASSRLPLAIASGALRREIELVLMRARVSDCFQVIVSAEDVTRGKPDPESFLKACELTGQSSNEKIEPRNCLVIEDSIHGIRAAREAGMRCLAVTNSYAKHKLSDADRVVETLEGLTVSELESIFEHNK